MNGWLGRWMGRSEGWEKERQTDMRVEENEIFSLTFD